MEYSAEELEIEHLVLKQVADLNRKGLWKRLKQLPLPKDPKCHWDYVLEEMQWMSKIIAEERALKDKKTKKCAKMIQNHFRMEELKASKNEKIEENQRRRNANQVSKIIKQFWSNAGMLVEFKFKSIADIARRRRLDEKLSRVLSTSEKFAEEISSNLENQASSAVNDTETEKDEDFETPTESEDDVEDTIEKEEKMTKLNARDYEIEINELLDENDLSHEQLLAKYSGYLKMNYPKSVSPDITDISQYSSSPSKTTAANEKRRARKRKHRLTGNSKNSLSSSEPEEQAYNLRTKRNNLENTVNVERSNDTENNYSSDNGVGLDDLVKDDFLPSGHTFDSTNVTTKAPYLLRHPLREYQHIGLDWLVTLYDRKLNGILADEMGLGKTIQTIALLAYLALEKGNWGPHLIIVPTSLILNWELELLRWCPSFKILTYYGSTKERKQRRTGWSVPNSFHICITSYALAVQDHLCFRRKPWEYMILDEAHNIKNFKSQRWQVLLNFNTKRRLLLTGTPLQNDLMELWSLLHFLMPHVFESHSEFREWFSKPISEITSGSREYNDMIVKQFHKTLRPFMLRRLKSEVEKQMPKKIEHVIKCKLSKRQRHLYDEFMARSDTKKSINAGSFLNVLNVLMQLRKVCNHPDLFEPRPIISSLRMDGIILTFPKCIWNVVDFDFTSQFCQPYGRRFEDNVIHVPKLVYEPNVPVRNKIDHNCPRPIVNVFVDPDEMELRYADFPVKLYSLSGVVGKIETTIFMFQLNEYVVDPVEVDEMEDETVEMAYQSSASFSQSQSSQLDSVELGNTSLDTEGTDVPVDVVDWMVDATNNNMSTDDMEPTECHYYPSSPSQMCLNEINDKIIKDRKAAVYKLDQLNYRRYMIQNFLIDENLINCCSTIGKLPSLSTISQTSKVFWKLQRTLLQLSSGPGFGTGAGYADIMNIVNIRQSNPNLINHPLFMWRITNALNSLVFTIEDLLSSIHLDFVMCISPVCIKSFPEDTMYMPSTASIQYRSLKNRDEFKRRLLKPFSILHPIASRLATSFPDPRLVEYDCGKLQVLTRLLRKLKSGGHRVLLFTQMTKMLNILESFLNYQNHTYLRLDGGTKVDQRQLLVERFNKDSKMFCFLLSTRAGGLGINLTGADTVIFYDSDWNPTIDAQAQDRCHRIGQTRDVHIYRLISENSVEENILRTSNQKRLLGEHAIEEGKFNLEFFKKDSFRQLFNISDPGSTCQSAERNENTEFLSKEALENVLATVEDDADDRSAAVAAIKEVEAERNEFIEDFSGDKGTQDLLQLKNDFLKVVSLLSDVERYALNCIDPSFHDWSDEVVEELLQSIGLDDTMQSIDTLSENIDDDENAISEAESEFASDRRVTCRDKCYPFKRNIDSLSEETDDEHAMSDLESSSTNRSESESDFHIYPSKKRGTTRIRRAI